jgi:large subunit ribosomal protein L28
MPRVCHFLGTRTSSGNRKRYRGRPKYLGGVGIKITSKTKRTFKPNLQNVRALIDGAPKRVKASTKAIRMGMVIKPARRKYTYTREQKAAAENS